jgi:hypothetical protein
MVTTFHSVPSQPAMASERRTRSTTMPEASPSATYPRVDTAWTDDTSRGSRDGDAARRGRAPAITPSPTYDTAPAIHTTQ